MEDVRGEEGDGLADARAAELEVFEAAGSENLQMRVCRDGRVDG